LNANTVLSKVQRVFEGFENLNLNEQVLVLNTVREYLMSISPFQEPVDMVRWVPAEDVIQNDYNPNSVAPPEMKLLEISIREDGYTQPIVVYHDEQNGIYTVVDGFHRSRVGKEIIDIHDRLHGYLPVVVIDKDLKNRMASTIRHNRARGKHQVDKMGDIVKGLSANGMSETEIEINLGMTEEERVRLSQIAGIAHLFANKEYTRAWGELSDE